MNESATTAMETALIFGEIPIFSELKMYIGKVLIPAPARK
ncbi:hypothetical protein BURPS668_A0123 [Burkholderia pseudomallei 668]|nr:hypothetical protein BURPS668_A0123 [Burkholderia pseudomallei 668]